MILYLKSKIKIKSKNKIIYHVSFVTRSQTTKFVTFVDSKLVLIAFTNKGISTVILMRKGSAARYAIESSSCLIEFNIRCNKFKSYQTISIYKIDQTVNLREKFKFNEISPNRRKILLDNQKRLLINLNNRLEKKCKTLRMNLGI